MNSKKFNEEWRRQKAGLFSLEECSTSGRSEPLVLWGKEYRTYSNANLSIYSAQECNAACPFCVEKLRPESRGKTLALQKLLENNDAAYFRNLEMTLDALKSVDVSVSITGGEPSKDRRLPRILSIIKEKGMRKRTMTTNGSGLLDLRHGKPVIDWILEAGVRHLNISWAHPNREKNMELMKFPDCLSVGKLMYLTKKARKAGCRVRLSCVLLKGTSESMEDIQNYLEFASSVGVDNVVFRQLMKTNLPAFAQSAGMRFSEAQRVDLGEVLEKVSADPRFEFQNQVLGYYYYVEVWKYKNIDVVFEEADLRYIEAQKQANPNLIYEFVFHPNARLCSTWQPWDGDLGPNAAVRSTDNAGVDVEILKQAA